MGARPTGALSRTGRGVGFGAEEARRGERPIGYIDDADIPAWFGACDCFVLTSTMKTEAFGIVQLEAMSCHKPIVATRIPGSGVAWVNEDGVSGRNVTPGKPEEYAAAIQEVTANSEKFGESAYLRYLNCFTRNQMIETILEIYENS